METNNAAVVNRIEFVVLLEVRNGNPNGDPDNNNSPRIDPETEHGIITDGCLKRKIRNYIAITRNYQPPFDIHVKDGGVLTRAQVEAYKACGLTPSEKPTAEMERVTGRWMCKTFFDVRAFGGVMSTGRGDDSDGDVEAVEGRGEPTEKTGKKGKKAGRISLSCGKVHGPVQITFAESIDPVQIERNAITRTARVNEEEREGGAGKMGTKYTIPYALYRFKGTITPPYAKLSGFNDADLVVLVEAIKNMYLFDASSARPEMGVVGFYLFKHSSQLGNCSPIRVFNSVQVSRHAEEATPARAYSDYEVALPAVGSLGKKGLTMTVVAHEWDSSKEGTIIEL